MHSTNTQSDDKDKVRNENNGFLLGVSELLVVEYTEQSHFVFCFINLPSRADKMSNLC